MDTDIPVILNTHQMGDQRYAPPAVPMLDLKAQYAAIDEEVMDALRAVCIKQQFILGDRVSELENCVAEYSQCRFGIGVSSGTDALLVALMALEIGPGDEVITTPYTFFATAGAIARVGARPLFCDIDPDTYNIAPAAVERFLHDAYVQRDGRVVNRKTNGVIRALIPVHLFGQMAEMGPLMELAATYGLAVIEDAAQAIGAEDGRGNRAGGAGDIGCFSFFPSKNLGGFGDGGMCTTNNPAFAERIKILRAHGAKPKYYHSFIGGNFRLDEMQAAVLLVKFKHLNQWTARRQENARFYDDAFARASLQGYICVPTLMPGYRHVYNQYVLRARKRDELKQYLAGLQIGSEIYYPVPLHHQQCFAYLQHESLDCPISVRAARETLAIPIYPELSYSQKQQVIDAVTNFYRQSS